MDLLLTDEDVSFDEGDIVTVIDIEEVAQRTKSQLQTFRGEWFLDLSFGPDYIQDVFKKNPSLTLVRSVLVAQAEQAIGDDAVLKEFELTQETATRNLEVSFVIRDPETQEEAERQVVIG